MADKSDKSKPPSDIQVNERAIANSALTAEQWDFYRRVSAIVMPHSHDRAKALYPNFEKSPPAPFVHYTSAEAALKILKTKRLWMRSTACMADYREVNYGHDMFLYAFHQKNLREEFIAAFDMCAPGAAKTAIDAFDKNWSSIQFGTYIACFSEHDKSEDKHGRLSMWRSFAQNTARVAIVLAVPPFSAVSEKLRVIFSPVGYFGQEGVCEEIGRVIKNVKGNIEFLKQVPPDKIRDFIFVLLLAGVTCLKHEGFAEEREWRAIYMPAVIPDTSSLISLETKVINGVPQRVYELPLDKNMSTDLTDIDLSKMLDRVIIGPSRYPYSMYEAFVDALNALGVADAANRVIASDIPIRT